MTTITVTYPTGSYPIHLGDGFLTQTGSYLAKMGYAGRCAVVTNQPVGQHHADALLKSLGEAGLDPTRIDLPDGEQFKTLDTVAGLYGKLVEAKLDRRSPVLALGGGVLGDTAGFAAAIASTSLAMVACGHGQGPMASSERRSISTTMTGALDRVLWER